MKYIIASLALAGTTLANPVVEPQPFKESSSLDYHFIKYQAMFGKMYYSLSEYNERMEYFNQTTKMLYDLDMRLQRDGHAHTVDQNEFSDWSEEERAHFLSFGLAIELYDSHEQAHHYAHLNGVLDDRVDWVERGAVSYVRRDGRCQSAWANAAVAAIEGAAYIREGHMPTLSTQQIIDCDYQSHGCHGGLFTNAFEHAMEVPLMSDEDYPLMPYEHECLYHEGYGQVKVKNYVNVLPNDPKQLMTAVKMGPVAAAISSRSPSF